MFPFQREPYLCFCSDCNYSFSSNRIPLPMKRKLFGRKGKTLINSDAKHCVQVDDTDLKSSVRCPKCNGRHIILCAIED
jgi:predicted Zn-ribbon and HTH transcriptional regulator